MPLSSSFLRHSAKYFRLQIYKESEYDVHILSRFFCSVCRFNYLLTFSTWITTDSYAIDNDLINANANANVNSLTTLSFASAILEDIFTGHKKHICDK